MLHKYHNFKKKKKIEKKVNNYVRIMIFRANYIYITKKKVLYE